jgi:acyl CoA:acetate/3-ketoacid CoA transferase beta subunit
VIEVTPAGLVLKEIAPGVTAAEVQRATAAHLNTDDVKVMDL